MIEVRLLGLPLPLRARAQEHDQDLLRELALIRVGADQSDVGAVPARLLDLAEEMHGTYGAFSAGPEAEMEQATAAGLATLDVTYRVPSHALSFLRRVRETLEEVEEFCRAGDYLLTLAAPTDVVAYRQWVFDEFERQILGGHPVAWPDVRSPRDLSRAPDQPSRGADLEPADD